MRTKAMALVLLGLAFPSLGVAQEGGQRMVVSLSGGLGLATPAAPGLGEPGIGRQLAATVSHASGDYLVRFAETLELDLFGEPDTTRDVALLYGRRKGWTRGWARGALGVGVVRSVEEGRPSWLSSSPDPEESRSTVAGLAAQFDVVWAPFTVAGLGLSAVGNLNGRQSFAGLTASVHVGRVR